MWLVFRKVPRAAQSECQDDEVKRSRGPGSARYAGSLTRGQMNCVFAESAPLPVPGQGKISFRPLLLPGLVPVSRPTPPKHSFPLFVDHRLTKPERETDSRGR